MNYELYIFNKTRADDLARWDIRTESSEAIEILYSSNKFKARRSDLNKLSDFLNNISQQFRENPKLMPFFKDYFNSSIYISLEPDYHHLLIYKPELKRLILDSELNSRLAPLYLFSFYYYLARNIGKLSEDLIYESMASFFSAFEAKQLSLLIAALEEQNSYDAGGYLLRYLKQIQAVIAIPSARLTQLLRNRALAGKMPYRLERYEEITELYQAGELGCFSADAVTEYYEALKEDLAANASSLNNYYKHLCQALKILGLQIVAQRGSRVAHEQGPILINAGSIQIDAKLDLEIKKFKSNLISILVKCTELITETTIKLDNELARDEIDFNIYLDELSYLSNQNYSPKARYDKVLILIESKIEKYFAKLIALVRSELKSSDLLNLYDEIRELERSLLHSFIDLKQGINSCPEKRNCAVIFVQRPSSRSGHFIPRILLGENLYVETDTESEQHRLRALPFNFVCPEFSNIATEVDSFFENASISIVTDKDSGKPYIKWENAEDLAITLAPDFLQAIKTASTMNQRFHYQLETTLIGPLIDLFRYLLEFEISNIASIEAAGALTELAQLKQKYQDEIVTATEFCLDYYLLEDYLDEFIAREGISRIAAIYEVLPQLSDLQRDVAAYCIAARQGKCSELIDFKRQTQAEAISYSAKAKAISQKLNSYSSKTEARAFIKQYIRYPESSARKELLATNKQYPRIIVTSDKRNKDADYYYDFTVAPSRIDFGKHVVASITTLMGRMLGADDLESLSKGKHYIDLVSKCRNSIFESSAEAGSAKVAENSCRAVQYAKAISFQGMFQSLGCDGQTIRATINTRDNKSVGLHVMEHGTMASTGYCITKEPLFIILALGLEADGLLEKLGISDKAARHELQTLIETILESKPLFISSLDWQIHAYEEITNSAVVKKYLSDPDLPWLPNAYALTALVKQLGQNPDTRAEREYSQLAAKLIEYSRLLNETGIIQRVQIMNDATRRALILQGSNLSPAEAYGQLTIAFNAAYKGNVSDERENANQYLIALLLHESRYLKNATEPAVAKLLEHQFTNYPLPAEIRIYDPLVDPDVFMGGEMKMRAEACELEILALFQNSKKPLTAETLRASVRTYGADATNWPCIMSRTLAAQKPDASQLSAIHDTHYNNIITKLESLGSSLRYYELIHKGFYKNPLKAYQGVDIIQLNAEHDDLLSFMQDLVIVRKVMRCNKTNSLLVLIDNPQQGKKPLLDFDATLEWLALGGTVGSHMIAADRYEEWRKQIHEESIWARKFIGKVILENQVQSGQEADLSELRALKSDLEQELNNFIRFIDIKRDFILEKYYEAKEMSASSKSLARYKEILEILSRISSYKSISEIDFADWLVLGGRWILNGESKENIEYILGLFDSSEQLSNISKKAHDILSLFVSADRPIPLEQQLRLVVNAGSTKEADLISSSAADSLEFRAAEFKNSKLVSTRLISYRKQNNNLSELSKTELIKRFEQAAAKYENDYTSNKLEAASETHGLILALAETLAIKLFDTNITKEARQTLSQFSAQKIANEEVIKKLFGDHRHDAGLFAEIAALCKTETELNELSKLGEMLYYSQLALMSISISDENDVINQLAVFFDQYLNVHEEDYPPYIFHKLCAGEAYGFNINYFMSPNLREKMFKLAHNTGTRIYRLLHHLLSKRSVLKQSTREYRDALIGDHENGIIPIGYQHETICLEERMWDCMRALRNFVRNYHDRHPLPIIIKGKDATVDKLFRCHNNDIRRQGSPPPELTWIAGLSNIGKHSWDLNCVIRSPLLRDLPILDEETGQEHIAISVFTPYLGANAEIKQIYTSFAPDIIEGLEYIGPYADRPHSYDLNYEGFVHALVLLEDEELPRADLTMSAHTHPQYINMQTLEWGVPETWSFLSMRQMYHKTELSKILAKAELESLSQIEFYEKEFSSIEAVKAEIIPRLTKANCEHLDTWILKASKDSGGRGISNQLSLSQELQEMAEFIFHKTRTDDVVMQEFVPNNARSFAANHFIKSIQEKFVENGTAVESITPYEKMFFAMRSFQSLSGIKGYLFSVNIGSATVNAGQGAKMFYGEPILIMPLYFAGKVQKLMDEYGEALLKHAVPLHAEEFAAANNLKITQHGNFSNRFMLNGLFDYIPYFYISDTGRKYKIIAEDNSAGGINYYYIKNGKRIKLCSGEDIVSSHLALEELMKATNLIPNTAMGSADYYIDIGLAVIELNSGLGQANLLQNAIEESCPANKDLFLEWTIDLAVMGRAYHNYRSSNNFKDISASS